MLTIYNVFCNYEDGTSDFDNQFETYEDAITHAKDIIAFSDMESVLVCMDVVNTYNQFHKCKIKGRSTIKTWRIKNHKKED